MREHQIFGYVHVSAKNQNIDRQMDALAPLGDADGNRTVGSYTMDDYTFRNFNSVLVDGHAGNSGGNNAISVGNDRNGRPATRR